MSSDEDQPDVALQAANYGVATNSSGGLYHRGVAYDVTKKHLRLAGSEGRYRVDVSALARQ